MNDPIVSQVLELVGTYGYFVIFPVSVFEGPGIAIVSGFLASLGYFNPVLIFFVLLLGDITGDSFYYVLGRWGRRGILKKWGAYIGLTEEKISVVEKTYDAHSGKLLLFAKTQALGSAVLFSAGLAKMSFARFVFFNIVGSIPKILLFEAVGYYLGKSLSNINQYLNYAAATSFVVAVVIYVAYTTLKRRTSTGD